MFVGLALVLLVSNVSSLPRSRIERQANSTNYYRPLGGVRWVEPRHQNKHNSTLNRWGNQYQPPTGNVYNATRPRNIKPAGWNNNQHYNNSNNNYQRPVDNSNYQRPTNTGGFVDNNYQRPTPSPVPHVTPVPVRPTQAPQVYPLVTPAPAPTQPPFGAGYNTGYNNNNNNNNNRGPYNANVQLSYDVPSTPGRNSNVKQPQNIPSNNPWGKF